jgi:phosphate starvation-inducible PhoH-like protein
MKMFLTRLGFHSKAVVTGDITQIDLPSDRVSGLIEVRDILQDIAGIEFVYFDERDVVRHRLVQEIIKAYDRHTAGPAHPTQQRKGEAQTKGHRVDSKPTRPAPPSTGSWGQSH